MEYISFDVVTFCRYLKAWNLNMKNSANNITQISLEEVRQQKSRTDWTYIGNMSDAEITAAAQNDMDALPLEDAFFEVAKRLHPTQLVKGKKPQVTLRIDADVLSWYKSLGKGYQSRMNAVLKAYAQIHAQE